MSIEDVLTWILSQSEAFGKWWSANTASLTPIIIGISVIVAVIALRTQRSLARQRAAYDLFLKTELENNALRLWEDYLSALKIYQSWSTAKSFIAENPEKFDDICTYLSIYELVACGIKSKLLDEKLCFIFWQQIMRQHHQVVEGLLQCVPDRFIEYPALIKKWDSKSGSISYR